MEAIQPHHPKPSRNRLIKILSESGLVSLYQSTRDVKILCLQRFVRLFSYGGSTFVLVSFLEALGISKTRIGLFMTLTIAGDVCISFVLTLFADRIGRKAVLALGAVLMVGSGVLFALSDDFYVLLAAATLGVISPSGSEIGPFRAVEESVVAHLTEPAARGDIYAWYSLIGMAGTAFGMMTCGWTVQHFTSDRGWDLVDAYRSVFIGYAMMGALKLSLVLLLSKEVEADEPESAPSPPPVPGVATEATPLINAAAPTMTTTTPRGGYMYLKPLLPAIDPHSRSAVISLSLLFALDSFSSGLAPLSWITYFFRWRYSLSESALGSIFFTTSIIAAGSMLLASSLAKRFGNVNTMVFTHLPSAVFLALIPMTDNVHVSLLFLILRSCTQSMDGPPRSAFLAAILLPGERTAVMGWLNVVKSTAQSVSPMLTGVLADKKLFWVAFLCAGTLKACYDVGLLVLFRNHGRGESAGRGGLVAAAAAADGSRGDHESLLSVTSDIEDDDDDVSPTAPSALIGRV